MMPATRLEPLAPERAQELFDLLQRCAADDATALTLDEAGRVRGIVPVENSPERHLLGDFEVHA